MPRGDGSGGQTDQSSSTRSSRNSRRPSARSTSAPGLSTDVTDQGERAGSGPGQPYGRPVQRVLQQPEPGPPENRCRRHDLIATFFSVRRLTAYAKSCCARNREETAVRDHDVVVLRFARRELIKVSRLP
jgi:hypothetical protein